MNGSIDNSMAASGLWITPSLVTALIGLAGVVLGLVARDVVMALYLARRKRADEVADRNKVEVKAHRDLVRLYADPLRDAVTSLRFRLHEIVDKQQARYLLADAPNIPFLDYKRISTLYRIAAVLGWIRAIRRERSYLDPDETKGSVEMEAIGKFEVALADGGHVELHRLEELAGLWRVTTIPADVKPHVAALIDGARADYLAAKGRLAARDLDDGEQVELSRACADIIRREAGVEIDDDVVVATAGQAATVFGIKEAYVYRDWQAAIGDMMLADKAIGVRHFSVMGFGRFEDLYLAAERRKKRSIDARWFARLEAIIHDLDMAQTGNFDARRDQLCALYECCKELEQGLERRSDAAADLAA